MALRRSLEVAGSVALKIGLRRTAAEVDVAALGERKIAADVFHGAHEVVLRSESLGASSTM